MFHPENLNNLPTMAKLGGRPSILCLIDSAVAVVGYLKKSLQNAESREKHRAHT